MSNHFTHDQWQLLTRCLSPLSIADLLVDFDGARSAAVQGMHSGSWSEAHQWYETGRKGLTVVRDDALTPEEQATVDSLKSHGEYAAWHREHPRPIVISLTWTQIRNWSAAQPRAVAEQARAHQREWGAICHARASTWDPADQCAPGGVEKNTYPLTERAALHLACDEREKRLRDDLRTWLESMAPSHEPADLLELLAAEQSSAVVS